MKIELKDKHARNAKAAAPGKRTYTWDSKVDGLGLAVTDRGTVSWIMFRRWPPGGVPTRRFIADAKAMPVADARKIAEEWGRLIALGKDPKEEVRKAKAEELRNRKTTFSSVAESWFKLVVSKQRRGVHVEREVRREFFPLWGDKPVTNITRFDIRDVIVKKAETAPAQARNLLGHLKSLFGWARDQQVYGLEDSPAERLKPDAIVGKKVVRKRVLDDTEMQVFWRAACRTGYPYGPLYKLLLLTGARECEIGDGHKREIDYEKKQWSIPAERAKTEETFILPLSDTMITILKSLPTFKSGGYLFSTSWGEWPVNGYSTAKKTLDKKMRRILKALARKFGQDPDRFVLKPWRFHDLRRTMRTGLSALPIANEVREMLISHKQPGIKAVYDQFKYEDEKRQALLLWERRLMGIVKPVSADVIDLAARRAS
jgi:integrase